MPSAHTRCLFADTPPSRVNAPMPPNRQLMYGNQPQMRPPPQQQPGFRPHPGMRPPPMGFGMQQPPQPPPPGGGGGMPPPQQTRYQRSQVIFTSDDGNVQFLKFPPPSTSAPGSITGPGPGLQRPVDGPRASR